MQCDNVIVLDRKLIPTRFSSWCYVFDDNVVVLDEKLTTTRFPSWCIMIYHNVVVLDEKLHYESLHTLYFTHRAMI